MRGGWNETSDGNRFVMLGIGAGIIVLLIAVLIFTSNAFKSNKAAQQSTTTTTQDTLLPSTTAIAPWAPTTVAPRGIPAQNTTTTLLNGMTQQQIEHPEGSIMNATQLEYRFNQRASGLTPPVYAKSVEVAKAFALASATGQGENAFASYYKNLPNDPWVDNYELVYASTMNTQDPTVIRALVWWTGTERATGKTLVQVKQGFFLKRANADSLDIQPLDPINPVDDYDYGVHILG